MIACIILCLCASFGQLHGSAIPMWEYLSKQEKMSFLYSKFASQVESFCETSTLNNCNQELLKYGLNRLKSMPEEYLDAMDPYQRDANTIIWSTLMQGHSLAKSLPQSRSSTTAKPNSYEDDSYSDVDFGSQTAASARIDNLIKVLPPKNFLYTQPSKFQFAYAQNTNILNTKQPVFIKSQNPSGIENEGYSEAPLTGPLVIRVYPDGTPVKEYRPMPQDEDLRQYKLSKVVIPNI